MTTTRVHSIPTVIAVTGASGAGKTTLVRALDAARLPGVGCYYFDSVGVPTLDEMTARHGGPEAWQRDTAAAWMRRLAANADGVRTAVLDGQVRPTFLRDAFAAAGVTDGHMILVDCAPHARSDRLQGARAQPELATAQMNTWAAYLRGQADALGAPVLDTTADAPEASAAKFRALVEALGTEAVGTQSTAAERRLVQHGAPASHDAILAAEDALRRAMLANDVDALDRLIADELVFTSLDGALVTKSMDLAAHRARLLRATRLTPSERVVRRYGSTAVVVTRFDAEATYAGAPATGAFRYTRVWHETAAGWQVVAGHMGAIAP